MDYYVEESSRQCRGMTVVINVVNIEHFSRTKASSDYSPSVPVIIIITLYFKPVSLYNTCNKYNKYGRAWNYKRKLKQTVLSKLLDVPILGQIKLRRPVAPLSYHGLKGLNEKLSKLIKR